MKAFWDLIDAVSTFLEKHCGPEGLKEALKDERLSHVDTRYTESSAPYFSSGASTYAQDDMGRPFSDSEILATLRGVRGAETLQMYIKMPKLLLMMRLEVVRMVHSEH